MDEILKRIFSILLLKRFDEERKPSLSVFRCKFLLLLSCHIHMYERIYDRIVRMLVQYLEILASRSSRQTCRKITLFCVAIFSNFIKSVVIFYFSYKFTFLKHVLDVMNEVGEQTRQTLGGKWRAEFPILCVLSQITVGNMAFFEISADTMKRYRKRINSSTLTVWCVRRIWEPLLSCAPPVPFEIG